MPLKTFQDEQPSMNMTPMIDVVFQLIIFFMVGTQFAEAERNIGLKVPEVPNNQALAAAPERRAVNVYRDGMVTLDRQPVTLDELTRRLTAARRQYPDLGILIRGDAQVPFQHVAEALNACKRAGISELSISVRIAPRENP